MLHSNRCHNTSVYRQIRVKKRLNLYTALRGTNIHIDSASFINRVAFNVYTHIHFFFSLPLSLILDIGNVDCVPEI